MYYIARWEHNSSKQSYVECPNAKKVTVPEYENFEFIAHRELLHDGSYSTKGWRISEATTGYLCGGNHSKTIAECIIKTKQILDNVGLEQFIQCINKASKIKDCKE